jgi:maltose/moltooligosaccharide transporter
MSKLQEIPPSSEELLHLKNNPTNVFTPFIEIFEAIKDMPKIMWQLFLVYFFQWYALMVYWQNNSKSMALSVWNTGTENKVLYEEAVKWNGLIGAFGFIVTFSVAFYLAVLAKKYSAKYVHFVCLLLSGIAFICFPMIENKFLFFAVIVGYGIGWASMMGIPYLMVVSEIPKARYGVYMGIINMMIVIPMVIQNLSFGYILKHFLNNDSRLAVTFAGIFLLLSAVCTLFIQNKKVASVK